MEKPVELKELEEFMRILANKHGHLYANTVSGIFGLRAMIGVVYNQTEDKELCDMMSTILATVVGSLSDMVDESLHRSLLKDVMHYAEIHDRIKSKEQEKSFNEAQKYKLH
jgi:hypothetical protein